MWRYLGVVLPGALSEFSGPTAGLSLCSISDFYLNTRPGMHQSVACMCDTAQLPRTEARRGTGPRWQEMSL